MSNNVNIEGNDLKIDKTVNENTTKVKLIYSKFNILRF